VHGNYLILDTCRRLFDSVTILLPSIILELMSCCNRYTGWHSWWRHSAGLTVCLLGPTWRQRRQQGIPGIEREAPGHGGCWRGPGCRAVPNLCPGRWASGPEPHEIQQIQQRCVQGCLLSASFWTVAEETDNPKNVEYCTL
jgi:hypothetical protein